MLYEVITHESSANDFSVVTRPFQNNDTQRWLVIPECGVYTIQMKGQERAYTSPIWYTP